MDESMKKICILFAAITMLIFASSVFAEDVKFGVVDLQKIIDQSNAGKKAKSEMDAKIKVAEADYVKKQDQVLKLKEEIEKQAPMLSPAALAEKERQYEDKLLELKRLYQDYNYDLANKEIELIKIISVQIDGILKKIGKEQGYTIILEKNGSAVIYYSASVDVTDMVIKEMNK